MEPEVERYSHQFGHEYAWVYQGKILGTVAPIRKGQPTKWRAMVNSRVVGVYTGANGRVVAMQAVRHFSKHMWVNQ